MKRLLLFLGVTLLLMTDAYTASAELGGQVFYRYGRSELKHSRANQIYVDAYPAGSARSTDDSGMSIAAGLDIPLTKHGENTILGEIMVEYSKFSEKRVTQMTSVLVDDVTGGAVPPIESNVTVSELIVVVAPKYRFELGKLRPWIIPVGLAFMVNSPPSTDSTYLDIGYHYGLGVEYMVSDLLSVGVDYRGTIANEDPNMDASYTNMAAYVGINF